MEWPETEAIEGMDESASLFGDLEGQQVEELGGMEDLGSMDDALFDTDDFGNEKHKEKEKVAHGGHGEGHVGHGEHSGHGGSHHGGHSDHGGHGGSHHGDSEHGGNHSEHGGHGGSHGEHGGHSQHEASHAHQPEESPDDLYTADADPFGDLSAFGKSEGEENIWSEESIFDAGDANFGEESSLSSDLGDEFAEVF
jgi:hypothetical protein